MCIPRELLAGQLEGAGQKPQLWQMKNWLEGQKEVKLKEGIPIQNLQGHLSQEVFLWSLWGSYLLCRWCWAFNRELGHWYPKHMVADFPWPSSCSPWTRVKPSPVSKGQGKRSCSSRDDTLKGSSVMTWWEKQNHRARNSDHKYQKYLT